MSTKSKSAVPTKKAAGKVVNPEKKEKTEKDNARFNAVVEELGRQEIIGGFTSINNRHFHEKIGNFVGLYTLEAISKLKKKELSAGLTDPFPPESYVLLEEKLSGKVSNNRAPKTKGGKPSAPVVKRMPVLVGSKKDPSPKEEVDAEVDVEIDADDNAEEDKPAPETQSKDESKEEAKQNKKKNLLQIPVSAKTYFGFIVDRFAYELYNTKGNTSNFKQNEEFVDFALSRVSKDFTSHITRSIVPTVERLQDSVMDMNDHGLDGVIKNRLEEYFEGKKTLVEYLAKYLVIYFKLIGSVLADFIWSEKRISINDRRVETVMRLLDKNNHKFLVDKKVASDDDNSSDYGLTCGVLNLASMYQTMLNPRRETKPKAKGTSKGKKAETKTAPEEDADEADEAEEEADADADADADEAENDADEADEAEEEEAPAPVKPVKAVGKKVAEPAKPVAKPTVKKIVK